METLQQTTQWGFENPTETKETIIFDETQRCKAMIRKHIAKICHIAMNAPTIKESNVIFEREFIKVRELAFEAVRPSVKPYVVYQVNKHFQYLFE